ncbi:hypothetical protein BDR04DRAFT_1129233 [Suillus decipiens]|nr:hypothetical protein BDR04DRAFT_1129233 [Suillus decipiens]
MNRHISTPGMHHSNQIGELIAILVALQSTNLLTPVKIVTDSKYVINGLNIHLDVWENTGWINIANAQLFKAIAYQLRRCPAQTTFQWVKGHNQLTQEGALRLTTDIINTYIAYKRPTLCIIDMTRCALETITKTLETDESIWCEEPESMEHILIHCDNPNRKKIWSLVRKLWPNKHGPWPKPTLGLISGSMNISLPNNT